MVFFTTKSFVVFKKDGVNFGVHRVHRGAPIKWVYLKTAKSHAGKSPKVPQIRKSGHLPRHLLARYLDIPLLLLLGA